MPTQKNPDSLPNPTSLPTWLKRLVVVVFILILLGVTPFFCSKLDELSAIDRCLDRGGQWNYVTKACEFEESEATARPDRQ